MRTGERTSSPSSFSAWSTATIFAGNDVCSRVDLNRLLSTISAWASRFSSKTTRVPSRPDSSLKSAMPSMRRALMASAVFASSSDLVTR